jgi:cobalt transporter subunit CbtB
MTSSTASLVRSNIGVSQRILAVALFLFGAGLVFTTGFAQPGLLHDAAHDTRHAISFPCH